MLSMYLNDHEHGVLIERFHYNYLLHDAEPRAQVEIALSDQINEDVAFLSGLGHEDITHVVIKSEDVVLYDVDNVFVIASLSDIIEDGHRTTSLEFKAK